MTELPTVVAIFNTSPDTVDMLRILFEHGGYVVVSAFTWELRDGHVDLETFCRQHQPTIIVYDIALPYEANWRLFLHMQNAAALRSAQFVLTTTNEAQVRKLAGPDVELFEIVGKPYDLDLLLNKVRSLAPPGAAPTSPP
jgi:DNA-binding response OmpR family regulator